MSILKAVRIYIFVADDLDIPKASRTKIKTTLRSA